MEIEYYTKDVYGSELIYIKNDELANVVRALTGKKTVSAWDIKMFGKLGITFVEVLRPKT